MLARRDARRRWSRRTSSSSCCARWPLPRWRSSPKRGRRARAKTRRPAARAGGAPRVRRAALTSGIVWWLASLFISILPAFVATLLGVRSPALQGALALVVFVVSPLAQIFARGTSDRFAARAGLIGDGGRARGAAGRGAGALAGSIRAGQRRRGRRARARISWARRARSTASRRRRPGRVCRRASMRSPTSASASRCWPSVRSRRGSGCTPRSRRRGPGVGRRARAGGRRPEPAAAPRPDAKRCAARRVSAEHEPPRLARVCARRAGRLARCPGRR